MNEKFPLSFGADLLEWLRALELRLDRLERALVAPERPTSWASPETIAREYGIPIATLRGWLHHRGSNGLSAAVTQKGRRLYLARETFDAWFRQQARP